MTAASASALSVKGLNARYGPAHVLFDLDLSLETGRTLAVLGRNGAGKTTLLRSIARGLVSTHGEVWHGRTRLDRLQPDQAARAGVQLVPEDRRIFASLTVEENLLLGHQASRGREKRSVAEMVEMFPMLSDLLQRNGYALSGGEQQLVAIARAMMASPTLLLLDEPSEGLAPRIVQEVGDGLRAIIERYAVTVVLAEQNVRFALQIADDVCVLDDGRAAFQGGETEFSAHPEIRDRYLKV
jgi:branched-chain amino acid transport system ATP-binding protein